MAPIKTERRLHLQSESQSCSFDTTTLPELVAEHIATFLDGKDLINLGKTSKFWNEISRKNFIWKTLVEKRFGRQATSEYGSSEVEYKKLFYKLAASAVKKPATAFQVVHLNGKYLEKAKDSESEFGEVIQLNAVCWLEIDTNFIGVLPGKYSLVWRMKLDGVYVNTEAPISFRARPEKPSYGTEVCFSWKSNDFLEAQRLHGRGKWFEQNMGSFEVTTPCKVYVEITARITHCLRGGATVLQETRMASSNRSVAL
ncbi:hypothetical protein AWC38_SpisGene19428 [Stylophora pistillata]|uniref:F-box domain-containing protein n=1 Tax=Stylophora pistillata TaxID=50429 RepID=A0A2B4RIW7_STYPI|nr:hypothetical protein AWC38_SpisGene19428 [Stylophora pistillata]